MSSENDILHEERAQNALWAEFRNKCIPYPETLIELIREAQGNYIAGKAIELFLSPDLKFTLIEKGIDLQCLQPSPVVWNGVSPERIGFAVDVAIRNLAKLNKSSPEFVAEKKRDLNRALVILLAHVHDSTLAAQIIEHINYDDMLFAQRLYEANFDPLRFLLDPNLDQVERDDWPMPLVLKDLHRRIKLQKAKMLNPEDSLAYKVAKALSRLPRYNYNNYDINTFISGELAFIIREFPSGIDGFQRRELESNSDLQDVMKLLNDPKYTRERTIYYFRELKLGHVHIYGVTEYKLARDMLGLCDNPQLRKNLKRMIEMYLENEIIENKRLESNGKEYSAQRTLIDRLKSI